MDNITDKEFADELDAQDRLRARGYRQKTCPSCKGSSNEHTFTCWRCKGKGVVWEAPMERFLC